MRMVALAAVFVIGWIGTASAEVTYGDPKSPEGSAWAWAWEQIRNDKIADFDQYCSKESDSRACRQVPAQFVVDILSVPKWRDQIAQHGVRLRGARIDRTIDLRDSEITPEVWIEASRIEGDLVLADSHWKRLLSLRDSTISGGFFARRMVSESAVLLPNNVIEGEVDLRGAKIGGTLQMDSSWFRKKVNGDQLTVGGSLLMRDNATFYGDVVLRGAKIGSNLQMDASSFAGKVSADSMSVAGNLYMTNGATFGDVATLIGAKIGGILQLWASTAWRVDLSGAEAREVLLGGLGWWCAGAKAPAGAAAGAPAAAGKPAPSHWRLGDPSWRLAQCGDGIDRATLPSLTLRNFHVDAFQDSADAWPPSIDLEGFHYERVGGIDDGGHYDMRKRSPEDWTDWLKRDPTFSTQPYTQLSSVLAAAGHRDTSEAIQFAGREWERSEPRSFGSWAWLTVLSYVAGSGIGLYTFKTLWWVLLL